MQVKTLLFKVTIKATNLNLEIIKIIKFKILIGSLTFSYRGNLHF